jgi:hypothetical protein
MIAKDNQKPILSFNSQQKSPTASNTNPTSTQYKIIQNPNKASSQQQIIINGSNVTNPAAANTSNLFSKMLHSQFLKPTSIINSFGSSSSNSNNTQHSIETKPQINLNVSGSLLYISFFFLLSEF